MDFQLKNSTLDELGLATKELTFFRKWIGGVWEAQDPQTDEIQTEVSIFHSFELTHLNNSHFNDYCIYIFFAIKVHNGGTGSGFQNPYYTLLEANFEYMRFFYLHLSEEMLKPLIKVALLQRYNNMEYIDGRPTAEIQSNIIYSEVLYCLVNNHKHVSWSDERTPIEYPLLYYKNKEDHTKLVQLLGGAEAVINLLKESKKIKSFKIVEEREEVKLFSLMWNFEHERLSQKEKSYTRYFLYLPDSSPKGDIVEVSKRHVYPMNLDNALMTAYGIDSRYYLKMKNIDHYQRYLLLKATNKHK